MATWLNSTRDGMLAPSLLYASEMDAWRALEAKLADARRIGSDVSEADLEGIPMWTVRGPAGEIVATYWLSDEEHGPAMRAES